MFASFLLKERGDRSLDGMDHVVMVAIGLSCALPPLIAVVYHHVRRREAAEAVTARGGEPLVVVAGPEAL